MSSTNKTNKRKKKKKSHQRSYSSDTKRYTHFPDNQYKIQRKLGPIDIGRIKYKGTKYTDDSDANFLEEKIHHHSRSASFNLRKKAHPILKAPRLNEIGTPNNWKKPEFNIPQSPIHFLEDYKPMHVRDRSLDKLKDVHLSKGWKEETAPFSWKPIEYDLKMDDTDFLNEKLWFTSSQIDVDDGFSHLLQTLPPEKLLLVQDIPPPTGYESKLNYLSKLKKIVFGGDDDELLNVRLSALHESSDESEISKLSDFSHQITDDDDLDKVMEDALREILAPSPSPQPPGNINVIKRVDRKELMKKVQMNLDDIQGKNRTNLSVNDDNDINNDINNDNEDIMKLVEDIENDMDDDILNAVLSDDVIIYNKKGKKEENDISEDKKYESKIPSDFLCPISKMIMNEAVMASDGRIYDKINIENWFKTNNTSPISGYKLRHKMLMPFNELTEKIKHWKMKNVKKKKRRKRKKRKSSSLKSKNMNKNKNNELIKDIIIPLCSISSPSPLSPLSPLSTHDGDIDLNLRHKEKDNAEIGIDSSDTS